MDNITMRHKDIIVQPFNTYVRVVIGSIQDVLKNWDKHFIPGLVGLNIEDFIGADGAVLKTYDEEGLPTYALLLEPHTSEGVVVHECFHLIMKIADSKGTKWSAESDEWYAYCLKSVYEEVSNILHNRNIGKRQKING